MIHVLDVYQVFILGYFLLMNGLQMAFILRAFGIIREYQVRSETDTLEELFGTNHYKPISLICPIYNEEAGVVKSISSLLALRYPQTQIIVVNDGSKDASVELLVKAFRMRPSSRVMPHRLSTAPIRAVYESAFVPNLILVDKENGGKSDALNCGLNFASYPLVCTMDGDSLLENDALLRVVRPYMDAPNVIAVGGVIRPVNGCVVTAKGIRGIFLPDSWLARFQVLEYFRAFLYGRVGLASFGMMFIVSGAFATFRRESLLKAGGFATDMIGEDFEMVVRLHRSHIQEKVPYQTAMVPDPICWTEVPEDFKTLSRQRNRWQRGLLQTLWRHRQVMFNPRFGRLGLLSFPYFLLFEALAPVLEASGYLLFVWFFWQQALNAPYVVLFLWLAIFLGILNSIVAILLQVGTGHRYQGSKAFFTLILAAFLENLGYRQLTVLWRLQGTIDYFRGRHGWGRMTRKGIGTPQGKTV